MNMVERVARAICAVDLWEGAFEEECENNQIAWRMKARAALEAMREPTDAMFNAKGSALIGADFTGVGALDFARRVDLLEWQAMINAALEETE